MASDQNDFLFVIGQVIQFLRSENIILPHGGLEGIDHRIAGDKQAVFDALPAQVFPVIHRRAEIQFRYGGHQLAVHLLRKGGIFIVSPQARLYVAHRDLLIKCRQCAGKGGRGVTMHKNHIRLQGLDGLLHAQQAFAGDGG